MSVVCAGELLFDQWPDGAALPGGAPANIAFHVAQTGCAVALVSRVGNDDDGERLTAWLGRSGVRDLIQTDCTHPTGRVDVQQTSEGTLYNIHSPAAWDFLEDDAASGQAACAADVVVFGTLAQRSPGSRQTIRQLVGAARESGAVSLADLNLRAPFFDSETVLWTLRHADVLKLNAEELRIVSEMLGARGSESALFAGLVREFDLARAVLTSGNLGAWIWEDGEMSHVAAYSTEVVDTVGAGDAFTAMLTCGLSRGLSLRESAPSAARLAAWVVSCRGATPAWTPEMRSLLDD